MQFQKSIGWLRNALMPFHYSDNNEIICFEIIQLTDLTYDGNHRILTPGIVYQHKSLLSSVDTLSSAHIGGRFTDKASVGDFIARTMSTMAAQ